MDENMNEEPLKPNFSENIFSSEEKSPESGSVPPESSAAAFSETPGGFSSPSSAPETTVPLEEQFPPPSVDQQVISSSSTPSKGGVKKFFPILLAIFALLLILFFGFKILLPRFKKSTSPVTLTYWGLWEPEEVMKGVILEWEKDHPQIKVNYLRQSPKEYRERLQSALARGEGPDIFRFHLTWVPMLKNELEPLPASVMTASQFAQTYYPVIEENLKSGNNYLGIPLMVDSLALYYNEDIFQAAGKNPPSTWEELRQIATDLTVKDENGRIKIAGAALGLTSNVDHWSDILALMMLQNGADLAHPDKCFTQAGEEVCLGADALTFFTIFSKVDRVWDETLPSSTLAFAGGKLAMYFAPSWRVFDIKAINPNLNFKIIPVPQLPGSNVTWATFWVEGVSARSKNKTQAWEFLKFLSSSQTLEKLYQAESNLRPFGEIYPRVEMGEKLKDNPLVAPFVNQMANARTWYLASFTWDNGINDRMIKYFENAVNAVNSGKSAKEALQTTAQGIAQLLSQYGISASVVR